jgi:xanthine dehydrogenase YagR molybdenum-binding subunit
MTDMNTLIGKPAVRIDGRAKVTGEALYPSDEAVTNPAWAFLVTSAIAKGTIQSFDLAEAKSVAGCIDILTYQNVGGAAKPPKPMAGGKTTTSMQSDKIWHDGQIIGVVVAESFEAAREAAQAVRVTYHEEKPSATFDSLGVEEEKRGKDPMHEDFNIGDAAKAFDAAPVKIDRHYETPTQHHNPIELFTTTCAWNGDKLTIYEPSQFVMGLQHSIAQQIGIDPDRIEVISRFVGGAFGSKGGATSRTAWIALAAKRLNRPVKLVAARDQGFTIATYRAETRHRLRLAADRDGKLQALMHEGWEVTSRPSDYNVSGTETTARMYACPNILTAVNLVHADRNTPGFMRAPPDTPYMFPLESAMDELAYALNMDPVELRRVNDTQTDPAKGLPFSSRHLMKCFDTAGERFGWKQRSMTPGSMKDGDWQVGWGCASAAYPSNISPASALVTLTGQGTALVKIAAQEIGNGAYTVIAITAADRLGLPVDKVTVELGASDLPAAGLAAGSSHTASICNAVSHACEDLRLQLAQKAVAANAPFAGQDFASLKLEQGALVSPGGARQPLSTIFQTIPGGKLTVYGENIPTGLGPDSMEKLKKGQMAMSSGTGRKDVTAYAFGAHFVEVWVHSLTREIRVPRMVSAFASGTIVNPLTAHSQYMGGMIWGLSAALHEKTEIDLNAARYTNDNIAEYLIPVNADIRSVEVIMVPEDDNRVNPMGIKGIGEVGIVGMNAAVANAVFHATGKRIYRLPIRIEDLLA